jgi:DNA-binding winged helix-turn-helix (wHTH) protein
MSPIYKEASFPPDYREAEVRQIMDAVYKLRSIAITGLAGMGKSNVVRFIVSHPEVRPRYLKQKATDYAFVHVDCAGLANNDETEILNEVVMGLQREDISAGTASLVQLSGDARHTLKEQILRLEPNLNLVLVLDYFDEAAAKLNKAFFNYLFHLRNARPRGNLSFIFVTRRPMGHLYELHELLDDGCVVGPLSTKDALDSIQRDEARMGITFGAAQREALIACTGGHPGFLKNACELLGSEEVDVGLPGEDIVRQLLRSEKITNLCQELWNDLMPEERELLLCIAQGIPSSRLVDSTCVAYLEQSGVLIGGKRDHGDLEVTIFCPLFETFVYEVKAAVSAAIRITAMFPNQARIETPTGEEWITLPPKLFALLLSLTEAPGQVLPAEQIISRVYGDEALGVTDAALSQLVKRLRGILDPPVQRMTNNPSYTCIETIRGIGYRFNPGD